MRYGFRCGHESSDDGEDLQLRPQWVREEEAGLEASMAPSRRSLFGRPSLVAGAHCPNCAYVAGLAAQPILVADVIVSLCLFLGQSHPRMSLEHNEDSASKRSSTSKSVQSNASSPGIHNSKAQPSSTNRHSLVTPTQSTVITQNFPYWRGSL